MNETSFLLSNEVKPLTKEHCSLRNETSFLLRKKLFGLFLAIILSIAFFVRFYKITETPPSLSWDEAAVGYNAWSVANFGKDEWGKTLPIYFKSFEDDKHPVHIYITSLFVKVLGPSDFSVRLPAVVFGVLNVLLIFLVGRVMFNKTVGLIAAFVLTLSPYAIHFSRFNHELNFTIFFFLLGLFLFYQAIKKNIYFLPLSFLAFGIDLLAYHSAKVVVPPIILLLLIFHLKKLLQDKIILFLALLVIGFFITLIILNSPLLGLARSEQASFPKERIEKTFMYKFTKNELLGRVGVAIGQYPLHFNKDYLFS